MWKREIGESGTKHLQGLICFPKKQRFSQIKKYFTDIGGTFAKAHIETMRGTLIQAEAYIQKSDTTDPSNREVVTGGDRPSSQGSRTEMEQVIEGLKSGKRESEILSIDPEQYIKYSTGIKRAIQVRDKDLKRTWKTEVYWLYGPTGTGKSKYAHEISNYLGYSKNPTHNWWDLYEGEEDIIIDDYRTNMCTFSEILRLFDRYPLQLQVKGSSTNFRGKRIFITTPKHPYDTWVSRSSEDLEQLLRRITCVVRFSMNKEPFDETNNCNFTLGNNVPQVDNDCESVVSPVHVDDSPITKHRKTTGAFVESFII